jgi:hypothetical protein
MMMTLSLSTCDNWKKVSEGNVSTELTNNMVAATRVLQLPAYFVLDQTTNNCVYRNSEFGTVLGAFAK